MGQPNRNDRLPACFVKAGCLDSGELKDESRMSMKRTTLLLALLAAGWSRAFAGPVLTNSANANRILLIDRSSMGVVAGKATLTVGPLERTNGVYTGDYKFTVFPWAQNNEKGRLAIFVSDKSLAEANLGKVVTNSGTATTGGNGGVCRAMVTVATPIDKDHGTLKLSFMAGRWKMIFTPAYHFVSNSTALPGVQPAATKH
jgi:hypothetical protein